MADNRSDCDEEPQTSQNDSSQGANNNNNEMQIEQQGEEQNKEQGNELQIMINTNIDRPQSSGEQTRTFLKSGELKQIDLIAQRRRERQLSIRRRRIAAYQSQSPPRVEITKIYPEELKNTWCCTGWAEMCGRRPSMEDAHIIEMNYVDVLHSSDKIYNVQKKLENKEEIESKKGVLIGVYDGHGGSKASALIAEQLHVIFKQRLAGYAEYLTQLKKLEEHHNNSTKEDDEAFHKKALSLKIASSQLISYVSSMLGATPSEFCRDQHEDEEWDSSSSGADTPPSPTHVSNAYEGSISPLELYNIHSQQEVIQLLMRDTFLEMNSRLLSLNHGSTATFTYLTPSWKLYVANVGDSRVVLCRQGHPIELTRDHRPSDEDEQERIYRLGGKIMRDRVNGILAITRALGDAVLQPFVSPDPDTQFVQLNPETDEFLIIACDGLWDFVTASEAIDQIKDEKDPRVAAVKLRDYSFTRGSTDNISVIVLRLSPIPEVSST